jgi:NAD(P)-dependent dehydrogenase (short-subunit alcohol dehydrogenase family)
MKLAGKRCWVVGSKGAIGRVVAAKFFAEGATILEERVDVRDWLEVERFAKAFSPVDVLVNCSGILGPVGPIQYTPVREWWETINTNLVGSYLLTRAVIPEMLVGGRIIHFSGGGAAYGRAEHTAYASSKTGLLRFVESVALEMGNRVFINAIAPGPVFSKMNPEATGTADPAAELALFLATDTRGLTGRMLSAVHDNWGKLDVEKTMAGEGGTLRRIPPCFE